MNYKLISYFLIGLISITSQIILLREFYVVFCGIEIAFGIVLSNWLLLTGAGSILSNFIVNKVTNIKQLFTLSILIPTILLPLQITFIRSLSAIANLPDGENFSLLNIWLYSFIILIPGCISIGMEFNYACELHNLSNKNKTSTGNKIYMYETLGALLGSLLLTFIFLDRFNPLTLSLFLFCITILFTSLFYRNKSILYLSLLLLLLLVSPLSTNISSFIDNYRWQNICSDFIVKESIESNYGNISIIEYSGEKSLYINSKNSANLSDNYSYQNIIHVSANQSSDISNILIIGSGYNGIITELLKYKPDQIDYIEPEYKVFDIIKSYINDENQNSLCHKKLNLIVDDPRHYVNNTETKYDLIINTEPDPFNSSINRFYTVEYYKNIKKILTPGGIYAFKLSSSDTYFGPEMLKLNSSIYQTLSKAFGNILIIPGSTAIILASDKKLITSSEKLQNKYNKSNINSDYFYPEIFEQLLQPEKILFVEKEIKNYKEYLINTDSNPISYLLNVYIYNKYTDSSNKIFDILNKITLYWLIIIFVIIISIITLVEILFNKSFYQIYSMFILGFSGISLNIILMLIFQSNYGVLYHYIGLIIAVFMFGIATGCYFYNYVSVSNINKNYLFKAIIILFIILCLFISIAVMFNIDLFNITTILVLNLLSGFIVGYSYSYINESYINHIGSTYNGMIYAIDLLGASIGALILSSVLIPIIGISMTCLFLVFINLFVIIKSPINF
ncbi:MAG: hypothetical protein AB1782_18075 [Cyanobacteriota bacterium]